eukprot:1008960-Rhodomonas_salina.1
MMKLAWGSRYANISTGEYEMPAALEAEVPSALVLFYGLLDPTLAVCDAPAMLLPGQGSHFQNHAPRARAPPSSR